MSPRTARRTVAALLLLVVPFSVGCGTDPTDEETTGLTQGEGPQWVELTEQEKADLVARADTNTAGCSVSGRACGNLAFLDCNQADGGYFYVRISTGEVVSQCNPGWGGATCTKPRGWTCQD